MKFKSQLVTQVSGSVGGLVGSHNAGGMYFRARSIPVNPNTAEQQAVRSILAGLAAAWTTELTSDQRAAWENYAAAVPITDSLGEPRFISGLSHYVRSNVPRLQAAVARVDDGPVIYTLPSLSPVGATPDASDDDADVTFDNGDSWATAVGGYLLLYASRPQGAGINYFKGPYRYMGKVAGAVVPPTSPATIALPFPVAEGDQVFFLARSSQVDGGLSSPFRFRGVAVA